MTMSMYFVKIMMLAFVIGTNALRLPPPVESVRTETAYIGWPHIIKCDRRFMDVTIKVKATGTILSHGTKTQFHLDDVTEDTPTEYVITYGSEKIGLVQKVERYILNIEHFHEETIQQSLEDKSLYYNQEATIGSERGLDCMPTNRGLVENIWQSLEDIATCTWYYNGTVMTFDETDDREDSCILDVHLVEREKFGVYTCAVNHNGQSMVMIHNTICYNPPTTHNTETIVCPTEPFKAKVGENIIISVKAIMGLGEHRSSDMSFYWTKSKNSEWWCDNYGPERTMSSSDDYDSDDGSNEVQCKLFTLPTGQPQCTMDIASINPKENFETAVETQLIFNNVVASDFGDYQIEHGPSWELEVNTCTITLVEDTE